MVNRSTFAVQTRRNPHLHLTDWPGTLSLQSIPVVDREERMAITVSAEVRDLLTLSLVPGIGPRLTAALLERFGCAGAAMHASIAELSAIPFITPRLAESIQQAFQRTNAAA